jgi:hypothetical protein
MPHQFRSFHLPVPSPGVPGFGPFCHAKSETSDFAWEREARTLNGNTRPDVMTSWCGHIAGHAGDVDLRDIPTVPASALFLFGYCAVSAGSSWTRVTAGGFHLPVSGSDLGP